MDEDWFSEALESDADRELEEFIRSMQPLDEADTKAFLKSKKSLREWLFDTNNKEQKDG